MTNCNTNGETSCNGTRPRLQNIININSGNTNSAPSGQNHTHTESNNSITTLQSALTALQGSYATLQTTTSSHTATLLDHTSSLATLNTQIGILESSLNSLNFSYVTEASLNALLTLGRDASFDNVDIGSNLNVIGDITVDGHIIPTIDNHYSLGSISMRWGEINLGEGTVKHHAPDNSHRIETTVKDGAYTISRAGTHSSQTIMNVSGGHTQLEDVSCIDLEISNNLVVQGKTVLGTHNCPKDKNVLEIGGGGTIVDLSCASIPSYIENFNILELDYSGNLTVLGDISSVNVTNMQFDICNLYQLISNISNLDISFVVDISNFDIDISNLSSAIYDLSSVVSLHDSSLASLQLQITNVTNISNVDISFISDLSSRVLALETDFYNLDLSYATDVSLQELLTLGSDASFNNVGVNNNLNVDGTLTVYGDILPSISGGSSLGSASKPFGDLHVAGSTIYMHNTEWSFTTISQTDNTVIMSDNLTVLGDLSNIRLTNFDTSLANIVSNVSTLDTSFGIIQAQIISLGGLDNLDISNLSGVVYELSTNVHSELDTLTSDVSDLSSNVHSELDTLTSDVSDLSTNVHSELDTLTSVVSDLSSNVHSELDTLTSDVSDLSTNVHSELDTLTSEVSDLSTNVHSELDTLTSEVSDLSTNVHSELDTLTSGVSDLSTNLINVDLSLSSLQTQVDLLDDTYNTDLSFDKLDTIVSDLSLNTNNDLNELNFYVQLNKSDIVFNSNIMEFNNLVQTQTNNIQEARLIELSSNQVFVTDLSIDPSFVNDLSNSYINTDNKTVLSAHQTYLLIQRLIADSS